MLTQSEHLEMDDPFRRELEDTSDQPPYPFPPLPALYGDRLEAEVMQEIMAHSADFESHVVERPVTRLTDGGPELAGPPLYELRAGLAPAEAQGQENG